MKKKNKKKNRGKVGKSAGNVLARPPSLGGLPLSLHLSLHLPGSRALRIVLAVLALAVAASFLADSYLLAAVQAARNPALDAFFQLVSGKMVYLAIGVLLLWQLLSRLYSRAAAALLAVLSAGLAAELLKAAVGRLRPCGNELTFFGGIDYAFPSAHAALAFAALPFLPGKALPYGTLLAVLISAGRLYLGLHWPSDVVAGALLGLGAGMLLAQSEAGIRGQSQGEGKTHGKDKKGER